MGVSYTRQDIEQYPRLLPKKCQELRQPRMSLDISKRPSGSKSPPVRATAPNPSKAQLPCLCDERNPLFLPAWRISFLTLFKACWLSFFCWRESGGSILWEGPGPGHIRPLGSDSSAHFLCDAGPVTQPLGASFIFKMKFCFCTQITLVIPGGSKNSLFSFKTMFFFLLFFPFINSIFSSFELLLLHFDVKIRKVYDNLDSLGLLGFPRGKKV